MDRGRWTALAASVALAGAVVVVAARILEGPADASPSIPDEATSLFIARTWASGRIVAPAVPEPDAFPIPMVYEHDGRRFGKDYPTFGAVLAAGVAAGTDWLVNPLLAGLLVVGTFLLGRTLHGPRVGVAAACLLAVSPSLLALAASYLNSMLSAALALGSLLALLGARRARPGRRGLLAGFLFGAALATRPFSAALLAVPLVAASIPAARRDPRTARTVSLAFGLAALPWLAGLLAWNHFVTGDPWTTPYQVFDPTNRPGFVEEKARPFTPAVALATTKERLVGLAGELSPVPGVGWLLLVAAPVAYVAAYPRGWAAPLPLVALIVGHHFYIQNRSVAAAVGGWRYCLEALPLLMVMAAAGVDRLGRPIARPALLGLCAASLVFAGVRSVPAAWSYQERRHAQPVSGPSRALQRFVDALDDTERRILFVDISTYNGIAAALANRVDLSGPAVIAVYREPGENRVVMDAFPGRAAYLLRWQAAAGTFRMVPYVPEEDREGPPDRFPYRRGRRGEP